MSASDSFRQQITVQSPLTGSAGSDNGGNPIWGAQVSGSARVQVKQRKVMKADQTVVTSGWRVLTTVPSTINDRVWLPGADTTKPQQARRWLNIEAVVDGNGAVLFYQGDI